MTNRELFKQQLKLQAMQNREMFFATKNASSINKYFKIVLENYKLCLNYLKDDFRLKSYEIIGDDGICNKIDIKQELEDIEFKIEKPLHLSVLPPLRKRFVMFRALYYYYKPTLQFLKQKSKSKEFIHNIDFEEQEKKLEEAKAYYRYFFPEQNINVSDEKIKKIATKIYEKTGDSNIGLTKDLIEEVEKLRK